jgi:hypothetical protein
MNKFCIGRFSSCYWELGEFEWRSSGFRLLQWHLGASCSSASPLTPPTLITDCARDDTQQATWRAPAGAVVTEEYDFVVLTTTPPAGFPFSSLRFTVEDHRTPEHFAATAALFSNCSRTPPRHIFALLLGWLAAPCIARVARAVASRRGGSTTPPPSTAPWAGRSSAPFAHLAAALGSSWGRGAHRSINFVNRAPPAPERRRSTVFMRHRRPHRGWRIPVASPHHPASLARSRWASNHDPHRCLASSAPGRRFRRSAAGGKSPEFTVVNSGVLRVKWAGPVRWKGVGRSVWAVGAHCGCTAEPVGHGPWSRVGPKVGRRKEEP